LLIEVPNLSLKQSQETAIFLETATGGTIRPR
jgi:hypothetical protein